MRARFSRSRGLPVLDEETGETIGTISGMVLNPDTGVVEGFFVRAAGFFHRENLFLHSLDILHWGLRLTVRHQDVLSPMEDLVRLQSLIASQRPILGQRMVTESGRVLGRCSDVQFSTRDFRLEWLFPRRFFRLGIPVPASQILEVRREAIVSRDTVLPSKEKQENVSLLPQMPEAV